MKRRKMTRVTAWLLSLVMITASCLGVISPGMDAMGYTERMATITSSGGAVNIRSGPGTTYAKVTALGKGTAVKVIGEANASGGELWYQIQFTASDGSIATGYVLHSYIKFPANITSDSDFEAYLSQQGFPESYKNSLRELHAKYPRWIFTAQHTNLDWNTVIEKESVIGKNLVANSSISSWKSTQDGAYNWNTSTWIGFDGASWVMASQDIIRYYMDPRNYLDETFIFTFLTHSYDGVAQTKEGVASMVANTFLSENYNGSGSAQTSGSGGPGEVGPGVTSSPNSPLSPVSPGGQGAGFIRTSNPGSAISVPGGPGSTNSSSETVSPGPGGDSTEGNGSNGPGGAVTPTTSSSGSGSSGPGGSQGPGGSASNTGGSGSYIDDIMEAAKQSGVNPYVLAAMILQEQGSSGSRSVSGTVSGYEGYYNFFNVEAYASGSLGAVERGLWYASQSGSYGRPWNSIRQSIIGGSLFYGQNYTQKGQDTFYLKKFNVQGSNLYNHQYMTNIQGAAGEAAKLAQAYTSDVKNSALEFKIPVFTDMPETPCTKPTGDGSPNNKLGSLSVSGFALTPTFSNDILDYDLIVSESVGSVTINATALDSKASVSGIGTVNLNAGNNTITIAVKAQNGTVRNYTIDVVRGTSSGSVSGPGGSSGPGGTSSPGGTDGPGGSNTPGGNSTQTPVSPGETTSPGNSGTTVAPGPGGSSETSGSPGGTSPTTPVSPGANSGSSGPGGNSGGSVSQGPGGNSQGGTTVGSYTIADGVVSKIAADTSVADFVAAFQNSGTVKVYKPDGSENTGKVGTGDKIQVYNSGGSPTATYTAQVRADNNGDGTTGLIDLLQVQRHILGISTLEGVYLNASDVNGNGELDLLDILMIQRDILGIEKIN